MLEDEILQAVCKFEKDVEVMKVSRIDLSKEGVAVKLEVNFD